MVDFMCLKGNLIIQYIDLQTRSSRGSSFNLIYVIVQIVVKLVIYYSLKSELPDSSTNVKLRLIFQCLQKLDNHFFATLSTM